MLNELKDFFSTELVGYYSFRTCHMKFLIQLNFLLKRIGIIRKAC